MSCFITLYLITLRQGLSMNVEPGGQPAAPAVRQSVAPMVLELEACVATPDFFMLLET